MKHIKNLLVLFLAVSVFTSCEDNDDTSYVLQEVSAPSNISAAFDISSDEEGTVTVTPAAEGATEFQIYFGDTDGEEPLTVNPGETVAHTYAEGEYNLRIVAVGLTGLTSELVRVVNISFGTPSDLDVDIEKSTTNPLEVIVTPTAVNATVYDIYFGDVEDEEPTTIMDGESANHVYAEEGTYTVRVVARGGGAATVEYSEEVSVSAGSGAQKLPITFDDATVNYAVETFSGASFEIVDNPELSGINSEETMVGAITNAGAAFEGVTFQLDEPVDFSGDNKTITLKFYSEVAVPLLLKFEGGLNDERQNEVVANHGGSGWEEISFNFATDATTSYINDSDPGGAAFVPTGEYAVMTLFVDGPGTTAGTFYLDYVMKAGGETNTDPFKLPVTFDSETVTYTNSGVAFEIVTNPNQSGINDTDTKVGAVTNDGTEFEAITFTLDEAIDFGGANKTITMKVYSEVAYPVLFKLETGVNGERANEVEVNHGGTGWEELSFDFANDARNSFVQGDDANNGQPFEPTGQYAQFSVFLDFAGTTSGTFYIDDISIDGGGSNGGDNGGDTNDSEPTAAAPVPMAPDANVISIFSDAYSNPAGANYYPDWGQSTSYEMLPIGGNSTIKYSDLNYQGILIGENLDVTTYDSVRIDVWSGDYTSLPFFLISGSGENSVSLDLVPNQWNSIEIPLSDFTSQGLSIGDVKEFKFDVQPDNGGTIYIDNLYFYKNNDNGSDGDGGSDGDDGSDGDGNNAGGASSIVNGDFETGDNTGWLFFDTTTSNGGSVSVSDAESNGGTYSAKITSGQFNNPGIKQERFGAGTILANTEYQVTLDSKVESLVDGAVVNVLAFSESAVEGEAAVLHNLGTINVAPGSWNTNTYTFTTAGTVSGGVSLLIEVVCGGATTCDGVVYIDNVSISN